MHSQQIELQGDTTLAMAVARARLHLVSGLLLGFCMTGCGSGEHCRFGEVYVEGPDSATGVSWEVEFGGDVYEFDCVSVYETSDAGQRSYSSVPPNPPGSGPCSCLSTNGIRIDAWPHDVRVRARDMDGRWALEDWVSYSPGDPPLESGCSFWFFDFDVHGRVIRASGNGVDPADSGM